MNIIIAPAKKMNTDADSLEVRSLPRFLTRTEYLLELLRGMSYEQLKTLWGCNERIAALNFERIQTMDLRRRLTPAVLSYEGIQYRYMAPGVFTDDQFRYIGAHLRILSGFYGLLRPFDGVTPYRLEMCAKLSGPGFSSLYDFWGSSLADALGAETDTLVNLASREYGKAVCGRFPGRVITCTFGEWEGGKVVEKGIPCKMARGELVRYMAERHILDPERLKDFRRLQYAFSPELSTDNSYVFLKGTARP
ncbi:peroxide stress protein YaaA [Oscillibacter sp. MSJ-2]|uniref:UPF0246 protein KQI82_11735 n=1 Tax=Dysosmobacter acutus TaxID=2841504 RepID=A0ABS6FD83_9FIRM|nr:peroxide stress protein YaaA [Dysosmobacter acutus]MBU5627581.1 peroxide stress protein YaaA [Dysosmobacter acutus]